MSLIYWNSEMFIEDLKQDLVHIIIHAKYPFKLVLTGIRYKLTTLKNNSIKIK